MRSLYTFVFLNTDRGIIILAGESGRYELSTPNDSVPKLYFKDILIFQIFACVKLAVESNYVLFYL